MKIAGSTTRAIVFLALVVISIATIAAAGARAEHLHGPVGIGMILGEPTGVAAKFFMNSGNALEVAAAWSLEGNNSFQLQADYIYHWYDLIKVDRGQFPATVGIGGRVAFIEGGDDRIGLRIPLGLAYELEGAPIDFFGQIVPVLDLAPSTDFDLEGALGARFYFGK